MGNISFLKVCGVCAIVGGITAVAAIIILIAATDIIDAEGVADKLTAANNDKAAVAASLWLFVLGPFLGLMGVLGLYQATRDRGNLIREEALFFVLGIPLALSRVFLDLGVVYELAPAYATAAANSATSASILVLADTIDTIGVLADLVSNVLILGIALLLFSIAIIRTSVMPKWIGWLGVVSAIMGGWLSLLGPAFSVFEIVTLIGFLLFMVWIISVGVRLLGLEESVAPN